jgi:hypothetical protein
LEWLCLLCSDFLLRNKTEVSMERFLMLWPVLLDRYTHKCAVKHPINQGVLI